MGALRRPAAATVAEPGADLPPSARALLRWLPRQTPWGAFAGQYDRVHCPQADRHALVNLWWSDLVVHPGDVVGPPRGGMAPGPRPSYQVALPAGGYLVVADGVMLGWRPRRSKRPPLVRADGQEFDPNRYSASRPYFRNQYRRMPAAAVRAALSTSRPCPPEHLAAVEEVIEHADDPVVCGCLGEQPSVPAAAGGLVVPSPLLADESTLRVLVGDASAAESATTLWRLSARIWDPVSAGRAMAAEACARNAGEPARAWPDAPITEAAVAHVAAQAVRHHGADLVSAMPAWLLGWVMVANPVLRAGKWAEAAVLAGLEAADQVRVRRVETQLHAMAEARLLLSRACHALESAEDSVSIMGAAHINEHGTSVQASAPEDGELLGEPISDAVRRCYELDVRGWMELVSSRQ